MPMKVKNKKAQPKRKEKEKKNTLVNLQSICNLKNKWVEINWKKIKKKLMIEDCK
jgi:hypothetical protein